MKPNIAQRKSIAELREWLSYNPETGVFTWLKAPPNKPSFLGQEAGSKSGKYVRIMIDRLSYYGHILAWAFMTDEWPAELVDHRNRKDQDNRWANLRPATYSQNVRNGKANGPTKGTTRTRSGRWLAQIRVNYQWYGLGTYDTQAEAHAAYVAAALANHGAYACLE